MKRTPLRRKTPMRTRINAARKGARTRRKSTYKRRDRDIAFMLWVKTMSCVARELGLDTGHPCGGVIEADHAGTRGLGMKCDDRETIPICTEHHRQRTDFSGAFKTWHRDRMRSWLLACIDLVTEHAKTDYDAVKWQAIADAASFERR